MKIIIQDDFDMKKIQVSGQCFRVTELEDGTFRFITGKHVVYIREVGEPCQHYNANAKTSNEVQTNDCDTANANSTNSEKSDQIACTELEVSCTREEWDEIWADYFDLDRNYAHIAETEYGKHHFADGAILFGRGLRILKQDKWEMLVTFIISQRKSIPAISSAVEALCRKFGEKIDMSSIAEPFNNTSEELYAFPQPMQMVAATADDFKACGLGYRAPYVRDAVEKVCSGELDLEAISNLDDEALFEKLMTVHGVGKKVANCVLLFGYSRTARVPVDVWIQRAIEEDCGGVDPFPLYGENGGIIQQYIFFYQKNAPKRKFPMLCPCCEEGKIDEPHGICPVCGWEDDKLQNVDENLSGGANTLTLKEHRKKYRKSCISE